MPIHGSRAGGNATARKTINPLFSPNADVRPSLSPRLDTSANISWACVDKGEHGYSASTARGKGTLLGVSRDGSRAYPHTRIQHGSSRVYTVKKLQVKYSGFQFWSSIFQLWAGGMCRTARFCRTKGMYSS